MSDKNPVFDKMLDELSKLIAKDRGTEGLGRTLSMKSQKCSRCGGDASKFKDELSKKEYKLTAWCQSCQDEFFG